MVRRGRTRDVPPKVKSGIDESTWQNNARDEGGGGIKPSPILQGTEAPAWRKRGRGRTIA